MRKIILFLTIFFSIFSFCNAFISSENEQKDVSEILEKIEFPEGKDFDKIKNILLENFEGGNYGILGGKLKTNYKYSEIDRATLYFLVEKNYENNENFFSELFSDRNKNENSTKKEILNKIPKKYYYDDIFDLVFGGFSKDTFFLLNATFDVNYDSNNSRLLNAIGDIIEDLTYKNCREDIENLKNYDICGSEFEPNLNFKYLPSKEQLFEENIFLGREKIKIGEIKDQIKYVVKKEKIRKKFEFSLDNLENEEIKKLLLYKKFYKNGIWDFVVIKEEEFKKLFPDGNIDINVLDNEILPQFEDFEFVEKYTKKVNNTFSKYDIGELKREIDKKIKTRKNPILLSYFFEKVKKYFEDFSFSKDDYYLLDFSDKRYSLKEAKEKVKELAKKKSGNNKIFDFSNKNYKEKIGDKKIPKIPQIFNFIPNDASILYVKNPKNLIELLGENSEENIFDRYGFSFKTEIKNSIKQIFNVKDFEEIKFSDEFVLAVMNVDFSSIEFVLIISENDKNLIKNISEKMVSKTHKNYIFLAKSEKLIDDFVDENNEKLANSDDFKYVWMKKSDSLKDIFVFVGDKFIEKMISLENFIKMTRKLKSLKELSQAQLFVWSYKNAFGEIPKTFSSLNLDGKITKIYDEKFKINKDGIVFSEEIGTLGNIKSFSQINYDLDSISTEEIDSYFREIYNYGQIRSSGLDPIGIVLNIENDGVKIDFFMTPIPNLGKDWEFFKDILQNSTKKELDFVKNKGIRKGIAFGVFGIDIEKFRENLSFLKSKNNEYKIIEIEGFLEEYGDFVNNLGGEFFVSLGEIPQKGEKPDYFFGISFKTGQKAKNFSENMKDLKIMRNFTSLFENISSENYKNFKIYSTEKIEESWFFGDIQISYTAIDNFVIIGLQKDTIKKVIDTVKNPQITNNFIIPKQKENTLLLFGLDGKKISEQIKKVSKNNSDFLKEYSGIFRQISSFLEDSGINYARSYEFNSFLEKQENFKKNYRSFEIENREGNIYFLLNKNKILELFEKNKNHTLLKNYDFEFLKNFKEISLDEAVKYKYWDKKSRKGNYYKMLETIIFYEILDFFENNKLFIPNITFGVNLQDDEIGIDYATFSENKAQERNSMISYIFIGLLILVFLGMIFFLAKKEKE